MAKISTSISLDADVKDKAQTLFAELGLDLSTAVGMFLRQSVREQRIPFEVSLNTPNATTIAAMQEAEEMRKNPAAYKRYGSFSELLREVEADA